MERLTETQIEQELDKLKDRERIDEKWMQRKYRFKNYLAGVAFVQTIANYAEDLQHHPFIAV